MAIFIIFPLHSYIIVLDISFPLFCTFALLRHAWLKPRDTSQSFLSGLLSLEAVYNASFFSHKGAEHIRVNFKRKGKQIRRLHKSTISSTHFWDYNVSTKTISHPQVNFPEFQLRLALHSLRKQPSFFVPGLEAKNDGCFLSGCRLLPQCTKMTVQGGNKACFCEVTSLWRN